VATNTERESWRKAFEMIGPDTRHYCRVACAQGFLMAWLPTAAGAGHWQASQMRRVLARSPPSITEVSFGRTIGEESAMTFSRAERLFATFLGVLIVVLLEIVHGHTVWYFVGIICSILGVVAVTVL
jgi:hypothetical protein